MASIFCSWRVPWLRTLFSSILIKFKFNHITYTSILPSILPLYRLYHISLSCIHITMEIQISPVPSDNQLLLKVAYPQVANLSYNFRLSFMVCKQGQEQLPLIEKSIFIPEKEIRITPLDGNQIYKVDVKCNMNGNNSHKIIYSFVPQAPRPEDQFSEQNFSQFVQSVVNRDLPVQSRVVQEISERRRPKASKQKVKSNPQTAFSNSESLMKMVGKSVGITNQKKLERYVLEGRKCRNTAQFLNARKEMQTGNQKRALQKQKMLLKGKMVMRDVYHQRQGMTFFKNDWFMGPFYSYDHNQKEMANE